MFQKHVTNLFHCVMRSVYTPSSARSQPVSFFTRQPSCWRQTTRADVIITAMTMTPPSENNKQPGLRLHSSSSGKFIVLKSGQIWRWTCTSFHVAMHVHHCSDARAHLQQCMSTLAAMHVHNCSDARARDSTLLTLADGGRVITIIIWNVQLILISIKHVNLIS